MKTYRDVASECEFIGLSPNTTKAILELTNKYPPSLVWHLTHAPIRILALITKPDGPTAEQALFHVLKRSYSERDLVRARHLHRLTQQKARELINYVDKYLDTHSPS